LRDQIKTWLQSNEIKDKKALTDARKLIEVVSVRGSSRWGDRLVRVAGVQLGGGQNHPLNKHTHHAL
jgi:hypothetical protein